MKRLVVTTAAAVCLLAACGQSENRTAAAPAPAAPPMEPSFQAGMSLQDMMFAGDQDRATTGSPGDGTAVEQMEAAGVLLAYSHYVTLELPARNVRGVMGAHEEACRAAGPAVCQVLGAQVNEYGEDYVSGTLRLRAAPGWLDGFRDGLGNDAEEADGRVSATNTTAEDLTRAIVDTEARLRAQRTLRERLENLLANQDGDVGELLQVERELARVQGDIDAAQSRLTVMQRRVEMSSLDITYTSQQRAISSSAFQPLFDAFNDFFGVFAGALAAIVTITATALPFVILAIPFVWLIRRWLRRRGERRRARESASAADAAGS